MSKSNTDKSIVLSLDNIENRLNILGRAVFGSESFGRVSNTGLAIRTQITKQISDQAGKGLHFYNMPTRDDITALAERCGQIDERLIAIEALLHDLVLQKAEPALKGPSRTKKPRRKSNSQTKTK